MLAALLFGASTPLASLLTGHIAPVTLAGILYAGSGCGLGMWFLWRRFSAQAAHDASDPQSGTSSTSSTSTIRSGTANLTRADLPWLAGAIIAGGIGAPVLLMIGLTSTAAASASLLLNMEGVLTALLAWCVFRENVDRRILLGMGCIVIAGALLSWDGHGAVGTAWSTAAILGACLGWAIDNNLTRRISASDPVQIACIKGLVAGTVNLSIAVISGQPLPPILPALGAAAVGFCGYGLSLVLFVLALRQLGTARTGAWFSVAPFSGAAMSLLMFGTVPTLAFWTAAMLMTIGLWLHLQEDHGHQHVHEPLVHAHEHMHGDPATDDGHHHHAHDANCDGSGMHVHQHVHTAISHSHAHYPDIHHRHPH